MIYANPIRIELPGRAHIVLIWLLIIINRKH